MGWFLGPGSRAALLNSVLRKQQNQCNQAPVIQNEPNFLFERWKSGGCLGPESTPQGLQSSLHN
eukprot:1133400-Pelagomonas_calceolata.AAC.1